MCDREYLVCTSLTALAESIRNSNGNSTARDTMWKMCVNEAREKKKIITNPRFTCKKTRWQNRLWGDWESSNKPRKKQAAIVHAIWNAQNDTNKQHIIRNRWQKRQAKTHAHTNDYAMPCLEFLLICKTISDLFFFFVFVPFFWIYQLVFFATKFNCAPNGVLLLSANVSCAFTHKFYSISLFPTVCCLVLDLCLNDRVN